MRTKVKKIITSKNKTDFEKLIDAYDGKLNVLILGTSGSGKSTLINAVLGDELAETGSGSAVTKEIEVYQKDDYPVRLIDTVGIEYSKAKQRKIKKDLLKFVKSAVKEKNAEKIIHVIWFCIDGTVHRIDKEVLDYIRDISLVWKDAPIITVFTKSYSESEIVDNIVMFKDSLNGYKRKEDLNVKDVVAVVAKAYPVADDFIVQPQGLDRLLESTLRYGPEGVAGAGKVARSLDLKAKRSMSYSLISAVSASAAAVGAVPIPVPDATILVPLQSMMIKNLSSIYGIKRDDSANEIIDAVLKAGAVAAVAKTVLNQIKAIPGLQIAGAVLNAVVASVFTFIMGEVSVELLERTYTGDLNVKEINWVQEAEKLFSKYGPAVMKSLGVVLEKQKTELQPSDIANIIKALFKSKEKKE